MELKAKQRNKLSASKFALPAEHKFPIEDAAHAKNAKARATQGVANGTLSAKQAATVKAKANKVIAKR